MLLTMCKFIFKNTFQIQKVISPQNHSLKSLVFLMSQTALYAIHTAGVSELEAGLICIFIEPHILNEAGV